MVEASTAKISSKGQIVIPLNVRKAAGLKKGEKVLAIAIDDAVIIKKITKKTFEETVRPVWEVTRKLGLTEEDINALVEEAKVYSRS